MKRKFTKSLIAMIALIAMLSQNAYSVYASATAPEPIQVENEFLEQNEPEIEVVTETTENNASEEVSEQASENTEDMPTIEFVGEESEIIEEESAGDVNYDDQVMLLDEETKESEISEEDKNKVSDEAEAVEVGTEETAETDENVPEEIEILDTQISGSGLDSVSVYLNTESLKEGKSFRIIFTGPESAKYDTAINDNLDKTSQGQYTFSNLKKEGFNVRATSDDKDVSFEYASDNGTPVIKVISASDAEKAFTRKDVILSDGSPVAAISGVGYDSISIDFDTTELAKDLKFALIVETDAAATVNGFTVDGKLSGLSKDAESVSIENLDGEEFTVYVQPESEEVITSEITETSSEDGSLLVTVAGEEARVKRVYTYTDSQVTVTATLSDPKALPDDAELVVTPITSGPQYEAYMSALESNKAQFADAENESFAVTDENTLLYDIAFLVDKKDDNGEVIFGEKEEYEPEEGSVDIAITFNQAQISEELGVEEAEDVSVVHLPVDEAVKENVDTTLEADITEANIDIDVVAESVSLGSTDTVEFTTDDFSAYAIINKGAVRYKFVASGRNYSYTDVLDSAKLYGITANKITAGAHFDANFATKYLEANAGDTTGGAHTGNNNPGNYIIADIGGSNLGGYHIHSQTNKTSIVYTTEAVKNAVDSKVWIEKKNVFNTTKSKAQLEGEVAGMISYVSGVSSAMFNETEAFTSTSKFTNENNNDNKDTYGWIQAVANNNDTLDLSDSPAGTYYFSYDASKGGYTSSQYHELNKLKVIMNQDQMVVFNIPEENVDLYGCQTTINGVGSIDAAKSDSSAAPFTKHVVWNMPNAKTLTLRQAVGMFIAPQAKAYMGSVATGWIVCDEFENGSEFHGVWDEMPPSDTIPVSLSLKVKKQLKNNIANENPSFTFTLTDAGSSDFYTNGKTAYDEQTISAYESNVGYATFKSIQFPEFTEDSKNFYYVIRESKDANWNQANEYAHIQITVSKRKYTEGGVQITEYYVSNIKYSYTLNGRSMPSDAPSLDVTNPEVLFENTRIGGTGTKIEFKAKKTFKVDGTWPEGKTIKIKLEALSTCPPNTLSGKAPLPNGAKDYIIKEVSASNPIADFGELEFEYQATDSEKAPSVDAELGWQEWSNTTRSDRAPNGTYRVYMWKISEVYPEGANAENNYTVDGIKYDPNPMYIKLILDQVWNGATGEMRLEKQFRISRTNEIGSCKSIEETPEFVNDIETGIVIDGYKTVVPRALGIEEGKYKFTISAANSNAANRMPSPTVATNDASGYFSFNRIKYTSDDIGKVFEYKVNEVHPEDKGGMIYSTSEYKVTVTVNQNGVAEKTVELIDSGAAASADTRINFTNKLSAYGEQRFSAKKSYNLPLTGGEFRFKLEKENADGSRTVLSNRAVNGAAAAGEYATVSFDIVERYDESHIGKTFVYYVSEIVPEDKAGIAYDGSVYKYEVTVNDLGDSAEIDPETGKAKLGIEEKIYISNGNGSFSPYSDNANKKVPSFSNTYSSTGEGTLKIRKNTGTGLSADTLKNTTFTFQATLTDANHQPIMDGENYKYSDVKSVVGPGVVVFGGEGNKKISFDAAGDYYFTLKEIEIPAGATSENNWTYQGITYDPSEHYVVLHVEDDGKGNLVVKSQTNGTANVAIGTETEITNTYNVDKTSTSIEGTKKLTGKELSEGEFSFTIYAKDNAPLPAEVTVTNTKSGSFAFGPIEYTQAGTYTYEVKENKKTIAGVTFDETVYTVKVLVEDNGQGKLVVDETKKQYIANGKSASNIQFNNEYNAEGEATIHVKKYLSSDVKELNGGEFEFELLDSSKSRIKETVKNDANGAASFATIKYTLDMLNDQPSRIFDYYVREVWSGKVPDGYQYDTSLHKVSVVVTNNTVTGKLDAKVKYEDTSIDAVKITNSYEASGSAFIEGTKTMIGRKISSDETIAIKITPTSAKNLKGETITDPNKEQVVNVSRNALNHYTGSFKSKELTYKVPGEYTYSVSEVRGDDENVKYDTTIFTATVKVTDATLVKTSDYGKLNATVSYSGGTLDTNGKPSFRNEGNAKGSYTPVASKSFVTKKGNNPVPFSANDFEFLIKESTESDWHSYKNNASGLVEFATYNYTAEDCGTHIYYIKENPGSNAKITYDPAEYKVEVVVSENDTVASNSVLSVVDTYYKKDANGNWQSISGKSDVKFENKYEAYGEEDIYVYKKIVDPDGNKSTKILPLPGEFRFKLVDGSNTYYAYNDGNGSAKFHFEYDENDLSGAKTDDGKYVKYYTITEDMEPEKLEDGFTYSNQEFIAVVTLEDNGKGEIETELTIVDANAAPKQTNAFIDWVKSLLNIGNVKAEFVNVYEAYGEVNFSAHKTLNGGKALEDGDYKFTLSGENVKQTKPNKGNDVEFDAIKYTSKDIGSHNYTIVEEKTNINGVIYSEETYTITVIVSEGSNRDGVLNVTSTVEGHSDITSDFTVVKKTVNNIEHNVGVLAVEPVEFINTYIPKDTKIAVGGSKTISGLKDKKELAGYTGKFEFTMEAKEGNPKVTNPNPLKVTNDKLVDSQFVFTFPEITFTQADLAIKDESGNITGYADSREFEYVIKETTGAIEGIDYDPTEETVTIVLTDLKNGNLEAKVKESPTDSLSAVSFNNTYVADGELVISVKKKTPGTSDKTKSFTFTLTGDGVNDSKTIKSGETVAFNTIKYTLDMVKRAGGTYRATYEVREDNTNPHPGYTYSDAVHTISVEVTQDTTDPTKLNIVKTVDGVVNTGAVVLEYENPYAAIGKTVINGKKIVNGGLPLNEGDYSFVLSGGKLGTETVNTVNSKDGTFSFEIGDFTEEDMGNTYHYTLREVTPEKDGITGIPNVSYSDKTYDIVVEVPETGSGVVDENGKEILEVKATPNSVDTIVFINSFSGKGETSFAAAKTVEGHEVENIFSFKLHELKGGKMAKDEVVTNNGQFVNFDTVLKFTQDDIGKDFEYEISEVPGNFKVYEYDGTKYYAKVVVSVKNGELDVERTYYEDKEFTRSIDPSKVVFNNKYTSETDVQFGGQKRLSGFDKINNKGKYTFNLYDASGTLLDSYTVNGQEGYMFKKISYTQADMLEDGVYKPSRRFTYTVKEEVPEVDKLGNVTYDENVYTVYVDLTYDGTTKALKAVVSAGDSQGNSVPCDELDFLNTYNIEGQKPLRGTKVVEGKNLAKQAYTFTLKKGDGTYLTETKNSGNTFEFVAGNDSNNKWFKYDENDIGETFVYTVSETEVTDGTTIDTTIYTVTDVISENNGVLDIDRTVTKPGENGEPVVVSNTTSSGIVFTNKYSAKGEITLDVIKVMKNKNLTEGDYSFVIKDSNGNVLKDEAGNDYRIYNKSAAMTDGVATSEFSFPAIKYTEEDLKSGTTYLESNKFYYTVVEENKSGNGIEVGGEVYSVEITVKDNKDGTLEVTKKVTDVFDKNEDTNKSLIDRIKERLSGDKNVDIKFVNEYNAKGQWDPEGTKELTGRTFEAGEFQFSISELDGPNGKVINEAEPVRNDGPDGKRVKFDSSKVDWLQYTVEDLGYHYYKVAEIEPADGSEDKKYGDVYDKTVFEYKVNVTDNNDGTLDAATEEIVAYDVNGNVISRSSESPFTFVFNNKYDASGKVDLNGTKVMIGRDLGNDKYNFTIEEIGNSQNKATVQNNSNNIAFNSSDISFLNYKLEDKGLHKYLIYEEDFESTSVTKDTHAFRVTVEVKDAVDENGYALYNGQLDATVVSVEKLANKNSSSGEILKGYNATSYFAFENTYEAKVDLAFKGIKHLRRTADGEDIKSVAELKDQFSFKLVQFASEEARAAKDSVGTIVEGVPAVTCDENGNYTITGLKYNQDVLKDEAGNSVAYADFYYRIEEVKVGGEIIDGVYVKDGVVYDSNPGYDINIRVTPTEPISDKLNVVVTDAKTGAVINAVAEQNTYMVGGNGYFDFTNIKPLYKEISGTKTWFDSVTDPASRPTITVNLYKTVNGVKSFVKDTKIVAPATDYVFAELPYYEGAYEVFYSVEEVAVPGYSTEQVGNSFINTAGNIQIRKIAADTGLALEGAVLEIRDAAGKTVETWTSGTSAHVVEAKLTKGATYTLHEVSAPEGYMVAADKTFLVPANGSDIVVIMEDPRIVGRVRLRKLDSETRESLSGAEFALYKDNGERVYASGNPGSYKYSTTASNGRFAVNGSGELEITNLPYGTYYFTEIVAPTGYALSSERIGFTVLENDALYEVTCLNVKEVGSVRLRKTNADGSRPLAGAVFELYAKTPSSASAAIASTIYRGAYYRVGTYVTDASGMIYVGNLPWDDYYFVEVEAPTGFELNRDTTGELLVYSFSIGSSSTADISYDLGTIRNYATPDTPPSEGEDTPITPPTPPTSGGEVRGTRTPAVDSGRREGGVLSGVLGVRAAPKQGVLGERLGPVTGDAANIFLWLLLLLASVGAIVGVVVANIKRRKMAR